MIRYAIRYQDHDGYGWTLETDAPNPTAAIAYAESQPDVVKVVSVMPVSHLISF